MPILHRALQPLLLSVLFGSLLSLSAFAQGGGRLRGRVLDGTEGTPLPRATVLLPELRRGTIAGVDGSFAIDSLPVGMHRLVVRYAGYVDWNGSVGIDANGVAAVTVRLQHRAADGHLLVEAHRAGAGETGQSSTTLDADALRERRGQTLGETIRDVPGVTLLTTGPSIAKPVIRGLHSQRVLILNNGLRQEGSQWGEEHGPEIDPFSIGSVEVVRGAAGVRYGSDAIGGVVRTEPRPLPTAQGVGGEAMLNYFSNTEQAAGGLMLEGRDSALGDLAWRAQISTRYAGDATAPGYVLSNTGSRELDAGLALGASGEHTSWQLFGTRFATELGILSAAHVGNLSDLGRAISSSTPLIVREYTHDIRPPSQRVEHLVLGGLLHQDLGDVGMLDVHAGWQQNHRREFDAHKPYNDSLRALLEGRPAFDLTLTSYTLDASLLHPWSDVASTRVGVDAIRQGSVSTGTSLLIPNFRSIGGGVYGIHQWSLDRWNLEAGVRLDLRALTTYDARSGVLSVQDRDYLTFSGVVGAAFRVDSAWSLGAHLGSGWRMPSINELLSDGVHHGTATYEIGDSTLDRERSYSFDVNVRHQAEWIHGELGGFVQWFPQFIVHRPDPEPTLTIRGAFPTYRFSGTRALLAGLDGSVEVEATALLSLRASVAVVRGSDRGQGGALYGMPADRATMAARLHGEALLGLDHPWVELALTGVARQTLPGAAFDYAPPPPGYGLLDLHAGGVATLLGATTTIALDVSNLLDRRYRDWQSRYRYFADEPGRSVTVRLTVPFGSSEE